MSLWRSGEQQWCSSSWLAKQKVWGSIYGVAAMISDVSYFLLPSRDMAEAKLILQPTNQPEDHQMYIPFLYIIFWIPHALL